MKLFAGLDAGTSGFRCLIVDERGRRVAMGERAWTTFADASGFPQLEMDEAIRDACADALAGCDRAAIVAIGVTSQRTGCVFAGANDEALYLGPNSDGRGIAAGIAMEREHGARIYQLAGRLPAFLYAPARLAWWRENRPDQPVIAIRSLADHVVWMLTGAHATEPSQAAEMLLYDVTAGAWSAELCDILGVEPALLPVVGAPGAPAGVVRGGALGFVAGTPVVPAGADTQCASLALGVVGASGTSVVAGTTMLVQSVRRDAQADANGRLWLSPHVVAGRFVAEAHCGEAGSLIAWLADVMGVGVSALSSEADGCAPGAAGLVMVDAQPSAATDFPVVRQGALTFPVPVLALGRPRGDIARAAFEGLAFAATAGLEWLPDGAHEDIAVSGGVARADSFTRALAGATGRPLRVATEPCSSALGAAICAAAVHHGGMDQAVDAMADRGRAVASIPADGYPHHYATWRERAMTLEPTTMRMKQLMA